MTISIKTLLMVVYFVGTFGLGIWGNYESKQNGNWFAEIGCMLPLFIWLVFTIVMLVCWILFT